tara:strand:+ start:182 stop:817 length:636 start_codon:yes stop_codon:yes gene_type:complete
MARITGKEAEGLMAAYARVHAPKLEEQVSIEETAENPEQLDELLGRLQGGLSRVGNLAGRAVGAVKQGAQRVGSAIKNRVQQGTDAVRDIGKADGAVKARHTRAAVADTTSPAAKAGLSSDMRAQAAARTEKFRKDRASGALKGKTPTYNSGPSHTWDSYNPVYDATVDFLVSEGYVADSEEAMTIMAEQEFLEAFNQGYQEVINEGVSNE